MKQNIEIRIKHKSGYGIAFFFLYLLYAAGLSYSKGYSYDNLELYIHVGIALLAALLTASIYLVIRNQNDIFDPVYKNWSRLFAGGALATLGLLPMIFLPENAEPFVMIPVICSMMFDPFLGTVLSGSGLVIFSYIYGIGNYKLLCYFLLILLGAFCGDLLRRYQGSLWSLLIVECMNTMLLCLTYFLEHHILTATAVYCIAANVLLSLLFITVSMRMFRITLLRPVDYMLEKVLKADHPMQMAMKMGDPLLAKQSAYCGKICRDLAEYMGFDKTYMEVAGTYYRLDEITEQLNAKKPYPLWLRYPMPTPIYHLFYNAKGIREAIQTPEEAMVYIVYAIIIDLGLTGPDPQRGSREMDIHRIMNNISSSNILDASGLTLNQFLRLKTLMIRYLERGL